MTSTDLVTTTAAPATANPTADEETRDQTQQDEKNDADGNTVDDEEGVDLSASVFDTWIDEDIVKHDNLLKPKKAFYQELTDRDAFRPRLETFSPLTYYCKPNSLSPIVCARFGWINTASDMLQCEHCKASLVVLIHPKLKKASSIKEIVMMYQTKLASAHKETCPFRFDAELYLNKDSASSGYSNIIPTHLASVLPRDFWELVEHPTPLGLVKGRFNTLCQNILKGEVPNGSARPNWQLPDISLPDDVLGFGVIDPSEKDEVDEGKTASEKRHSPSRQSRMLSRLAFDPSKPYSAIGWEKQTLLTMLEEILRPHSEEDEMRAQTRAQGAWEALYEGIAALTLFGWMTKGGEQGDKTSKASSSYSSDQASVSLHCPLCLSFLNFELEKYDWHHHSHGRKATLGDNDNDEAEEGEQPPSKRRRLLHEQKPKLNPLIAHRCYCPYVCGFPRNGERIAKPVWQTIAAKLLANPKEATGTSNTDKNKDQDDESATDRIIQLLQSSVSAPVRPQQED